MSIKGSSLARFAALALMVSGCASVPPLEAQAPAVAGQHEQPALGEEGYRYLLYMPGSATSGTTAEGKTWPLMIFLHGSGERGDDIAKVKVHGPPKYAEHDANFPFILISPLLPADDDWDVAKLDRILDNALKTLPVDPDRVYLTGLSRGGHASWRWAAAEPERFAAVAPVAGRGNPDTACALAAMPIWAFHGDRDDVVVPEGSFAMARAIRACGGRSSRLTIYPDLGHNAWDPAYADPALYLWLLSHRRSDAED